MRLLKFGAKEKCFRCGNTLVILEDLKEIIFYECQHCMRGYAKKPKQNLTDRWLSPISLVLYEIIFETERISDLRIQRIAEDIKKRWNKERINLFIDDALEELKTPRQKLVDMLGLKGTEENTRDYLNRLIKRLE